MPYTEEQLQYMAQFSPHICMMLKAKYRKQMEEEERRRKEEIMALMQNPTEEEQMKAIQELANLTPYHNMEIHPREHIILNPQPFYTRVLNKRKKRR